VATKENRIQVRGLIEELESRLHRGPPIADTEIRSVSNFLAQMEFSPASDYHARLRRVQDQLSVRARQPVPRPGKRNYGGEAGGRWMQLQSAYNHIIISTCYAGQFNGKRGRIKISHRFNCQGRIDFVELKFINALEPVLNGELRKLLIVNGFQEIKRDWKVAEAFVLPVLPRELLFLFENLFRCPREEIFAWLVNFGHGIVEDLLRSFTLPPKVSQGLLGGSPGQLPLHLLRGDEVAQPILSSAGLLKCSVQCLESKLVLIRY
jgi:hypothetical protein